MGRLNPSRETKFSGANVDRDIFVFPIQLTTRRIGNLTRYFQHAHFIPIMGVRKRGAY